MISDCEKHTLPFDATCVYSLNYLQIFIKEARTARKTRSFIKPIRILPRNPCLCIYTIELLPGIAFVPDESRVAAIGKAHFRRTAQYVVAEFGCYAERACTALRAAGQEHLDFRQCLCSRYGITLLFLVEKVFHLDGFGDLLLLGCSRMRLYHT